MPGGVKVTFKEVATDPAARPSRPRSGACAAPLPAWHPYDVIMVGGYTEEPPAAGGDKPQRAPVMEAWTFSEAEARWQPVQFKEGGTLPQPRLTAQAAVVGDHLWLVGGWDSSAAATGGEQFLNDVWRLSLHDWAWERVTVEGEEMPRVSRFQMVPLGDGRLLLHTHRSLEDVLVLDTRAQPHPRLASAPVCGIFPADQSPPSRGLHSLTLAAAPPPAAGQAASPGPWLYVFGGAPQSGPMFDDLWALDPGSMVWHRLDPQGPKPHARCSHVAAAAGPGGRYLLIQGGSFYVQPGQLQPLDDVAVFDTQTGSWVDGVQVQGASKPSARNASIMAPLLGKHQQHDPPGAAAGAGGGSASSLLLHAGWRPFVETYNDTYVVTLEAE